MSSVLERFLRYTKFNTRSDESSLNCPSTDNQLLFGRTLVEEMIAMGIKDAHMDQNGYIYGTVPGDTALPTIGLIAHMDTSPDISGENVQARVVTYEGGDVVLNAHKNIVMRQSDYESLRENVGKHLVITDGTTLLGADDKAGIAEILTVAEKLLATDKKHSTLRIAFTPDEEIGRGADLFDVGTFGAEFAYTVDGGRLGELEYENFNAAGATVVLNGCNIHPGAAKNKMVNSQYIAMEFQNALPQNEKPEHTEGYEGFFHLTDMSGTVEQSMLRYIIRDHDMVKFLQKKQVMIDCAHALNEKYGDGTVELTIKDSYYNMREKIEPCMHIIDRAVSAMKTVGIKPRIMPIRGGTDGARLSYMGLPCPNLFTGGQNFHGRYEYIPVEDMEACVEMLFVLLTDC